MYAYAPETGQTGRTLWRDSRRWSRLELAPGARRWLLDEGSLTARLVEASGGSFRVRVLAQGWQAPLPGERRALGLRTGSRALVREVLLECAGVPWVYARSILPAAALDGELRHLRRFGARSLGALLFANPRLERGGFEIAAVQPADPLLPRAIAPRHALWGRRSVLRLGGRVLLVQEVFLPHCSL